MTFAIQGIVAVVLCPDSVIMRRHSITVTSLDALPED